MATLLSNTPITSSDVRTATWRRVRAQIEVDIADARAKLESFTNTPEQTAGLRGTISALKNLLAHEKAPAADPSPIQSRPDQSLAEDDVGRAF